MAGPITRAPLQVFTADHLDDESLTGRAVEGIHQSQPGCQDHDMPDLGDVGESEYRQNESQHHRRRLRDHKQVALGNAIDNDAAPGRDEQRRDRRSKGHDAEGQFGMTDLINQPALRDDLHPRSGHRDQLAAEIQLEVAMLQ
jgi:hypothetical protein